MYDQVVDASPHL